MKAKPKRRYRKLPLIRIYRENDDGWQATDTLVGHKFSTLTKIEDLRGYTEERPYPNEHAARSCYLTNTHTGSPSGIIEPPVLRAGSV